MNDTLPSLIKRLWGHIDRRRKINFFILIIIMLLASIAEVISIGAVIPFLGIMTAPETVINLPYLQPILLYLEISSQSELLILFTLIFIVAAIFSGAMRLTLLWFQTRLSHSVGASIGIEIYRRTLFQPYSLHISRNSSEIITGITQKTNVVVDLVLIPIFTIFSSLLILSSILIALISIDPLIAIFSFLGFGFIYLSVILITQSGLSRDGKRISVERNKIMKSLQEGLGGIRDVLLSGSQKIYVNIFKKSEIPFRRATARITIVSMSPRYAIESLGMILIAIMAYTLADRAEGISSAIPILGAFALGAQRLLPVLQQAYGGWQTIRGGQAQFKDAIELLEQPLPSYLLDEDIKSVDFEHHIKLKNIKFKYLNNNKYVIDDISLTIDKGSRVGFIGSTGCGKSTLLDIIMGLIEPTEGKFLIDNNEVDFQNNRGWQKHIAHVPQAIFLSDSSIAENIAFGIPKNEIDYHRLELSAKQAQLTDLIESWEDKYDSYVGERGVRISGGQRQRIGIARALYQNADVIIFDEATSALDNETEKAIIESITELSKNLTIIMVAHRLTTLEGCSTIYQLKDGKIQRSGSFDEIVN
ncbi:MAG: ABC transporter ATP-binding protein [Candidatus Marinimicrobia bacterium]|nr:ABC transporter ATP-binding protein [Candidatus Neomarinimicrobiota bacterium]